MKTWLKNLDEYWFGHGSPVALGVVRIFIGFWAVVNFLMISVDFDAWFTEQGYVPHSIAMRKMPDISGVSTVFGYPLMLPFDVPRINILGYFGLGESTPFAIFLYVLTVIAAITTMLGLWTRVSTIILAVGMVSFHIRNGFILHGGDTILRVMTLYLVMAPCGLACSLDRVIGLWKGRIAPVVPTVSLWSQRLMAYNVAIVYFTTFWHKMRGDMWRDGTATWYPARLNEFDRFWVPPFIESPPFIYISTYGTLAIELALGTLVFYKPLRKWVLLAGLGMHAFIEYSMNIPLFAFLMCSCYVVFFSGEEVTQWFRQLGKRFHKHYVRIWTPAGGQIAPGPATALEALDPMGMVAYNQGSASDWTARNLYEKEVPPIKASWTRSLGAWPIGWIPGMWRRVLNASLIASEPQPTTTAAKRERKKAAAK